MGYVLRFEVDAAYAGRFEPHRVGESLVPRLVVGLAGAVRAGQAVLPGDGDLRASRERWLFAVEAESHVGPPLLVLALAAAAFVLFALVLRQLTRRLVF